MSLWTQLLSWLLVVVATCSYFANGKSRRIKFPNSECLDYGLTHTMGAQIVKGDGSYGAGRSYCALRLRTDFDRIFMVKFDYVQLACGQTLDAYFSSSTLGDPFYSFNCTTSTALEKNYYGSYRFLYFQFKNTDLSDNFDFNIIVTSIKKSLYEGDCKYGPTYYLCSGGKGVCIDTSVKCDGVRNCPNGDDESVCSVITRDDSFSDDFEAGNEESESSNGSITGVIIAVVIGVIVIMIIVLSVACARHQRMKQARRQRANNTQRTTGLLRTANTAQQHTVNNPSVASSGYAMPQAVNIPPRQCYTVPGTQMPPGGHQPPSAIVPPGAPSAPPMEDRYEDRELPPSYEEVCGKQGT